MSFRLKTILGIALIESILLVILIVSGLKLLDTIQNDGLTKRAESTTKVLASTAKEAVLASDLATLDTFTSEFITNPEVVYIRILDTNQDLLSSAGMITEHNIHVNKASDKSSSIIVSRSKIIVENTIFGYVEAAYSKEDLIAIYGKAKTSAIVIAITELILVALFSFFLGTYLSSQLSSLKKAAEKIATGDYSVSMKEHGKDEIAQVASAFNMMTEKLREKKQIDDINHELLASVQHTKTDSSNPLNNSRIFDYALKRIMLLTHSSFGLILTMTTKDNPNIQALCISDLTRKDQKLSIIDDHSSIDLKVFDENIHSVLKSNNAVESEDKINIELCQQEFRIESYIVIPINHMGKINGLVILSNKTKHYNYEYIFDTNRLAWLAISNLIYITESNQRLTDIQNMLISQKSFITSIYESVPDAIISISRTGEITTLNNASCDMFGYSESELLGNNISTLIPEPYKSMHDSLLYDFSISDKSFSKTSLPARELLVLTKTGELVPVEITTNYIDDPEGKAVYVAIFKDISRQKKQIEEIKYANRLATQSYVDRYHFISALNNIVLAPTQKLHDEIQTTLSSNNLENGDILFKEINKHTSLLLHNTQNIIYYTNLISGNIRLKKSLFKISSLVEEIAGEISLDNSTSSKNFSYNLINTPSCYFYHDEKHIRLVLTRLIQYLIIKHHNLASINMNVYQDGKHGKKDRIEFSLEAKLEYEEVTKNTDASNDMGLKVAGLMLGFLNGNHSTPLNGNLVVSKPLENTAKIQVKLDLTRASTNPSYISSSCGTILLVDDDQNFLELTQHMLENIGFIVHTAVNGKEAIDKFMDNAYTAVLLDCSMPIMDGYEATQVIREYEESKFLTNTPILASTGYLEKKDLENCLLSGMNDYIKKPFTIEELMIKLGLHIHDTHALGNNTLFSYHVQSDTNTLTKHFANKAHEYLTQILNCLNTNNWPALRYCVLSLQNMSQATDNLDIHELAIKAEYQNKLRDQSAIEETIARIESELTQIEQTNYKFAQQAATKN